MNDVLAEYTDLRHSIRDLVAANRTGADAALARIRLLRRVNVIGIWTTGIAALLMLLTLGHQGIRRIASYEKQLLGYSQMLEARNRELDAFAGRIAHDLGGPVGSLMVSADLLSRKAGGDQQTTLDRMRRSLKRIMTMIEDLLAFARADTPAQGALCNPAVVAAKVREDFAERFGSDATLRESVQPATVSYNEGLLLQALWNLVENGVKYRRDEINADISVSGRIAGEGYELQISDNGLGMLPEEAQRAFEPFYRAQRARDVMGTGLGLSIVKRIVEAGGGKVSVKTQLGHGTTFVLRLPLADTQSLAQARKAG